MNQVNQSLLILKEKLKSGGYSITKPRQQVFEVLQTDSPITMSNLYKRLSPDVDRTTVYRVIELFENLGISQKISHGWKYTIELTDQFTPHHHHFTCTKCSDVIIFDEPILLDRMLQELSFENSIQIDSHSLELSGLCAKCKI